MASRLHSTPMFVPHHHNPHRRASTVFLLLDLLVLFRFQPRYDEAPAVFEEPDTARDRDEFAGLSCHYAVDPSVLRGRGPGVFEVV